MEKITKRNAWKVGREVHEHLAKKYGDIDRVNFTFCGNCQKSISLYIYTKPNNIPVLSPLEVRAERESTVRQLVLDKFELECDIFFMQ